MRKACRYDFVCHIFDQVIERPVRAMLSYTILLSKFGVR